MKNKKYILLIIALILTMLFTFYSNVQAAEKTLECEITSEVSTLKQKENVLITVNLNNTENINTYQASIVYDEAVWEALEEENFELAENWQSLQYNAANKTFIVINKEGVTIDNKVLEIKLIAKTNATTGDTKITLANMKASDGEAEFTQADIEEEFKIEINDTNSNDQEDAKKPDDNKEPEETNPDVSEDKEKPNDPSSDKSDDKNVIDIIKDIIEEKLPTILPFTGTSNNNIIIYLIIIFSIFAIISFVKMKKCKNKKGTMAKNIKKFMLFILVLSTIITVNFNNSINAMAITTKSTERTDIFLGDISQNSIIDDDDIEILEKHLIELNKINTEDQEQVDMNEDSDVTIIDLSLLIIQQIECPYDKYNVTGVTEWQSVPIVSSNLLEKDEVTTGGEGCQWPIGMAISKDGNLMLYGTNVGGIYRSEDGGKNFSQANAGFGARGAGVFAIDPKNSSYVIAIGINSGAYDTNGIYLSEDSGNTWSFKKSMLIIGNKEVRDAVAYDESSYDATQNRCMIAYWSTAYELESNNLNASNKGLYKTEDGGYTWNLVNSDLSDGTIKINSTTGELYISKADGIYYSNDKGASFTKIVNDSIRGFDGVNSNNGFYMYYCNTTGLYKSENGQDFEIITSTSFPTKGPYHVRVSPLDTNKILVMNYAGAYQNQPYYSEDGGITWKKSTMNNSLSIMPYNNRGGIPLWSTVDSNKVWVFIQGDFISSSTDGGKTFKWDSNGITGILAGGQVHYNVYNSDIIYFASQDYNGCVSVDGGTTWKYINMSGYSWGGYCYGGYAVDENTYFVGVADSWKGQRKLKITFDGGKTVIDTGLYFTEENLSKGNESSYQSPTNPDVLFACDLRSEDGGHTWEKMSGCISVYTHNPKGQKELYGIDETGKYVVVSYDDGKTWKKVNNEVFKEGNSILSVTDVACDWLNNSVYVACGSSYLYRVSLETGETEYVINKNIAKYNVAPLNMKGKNLISKVEVDPNDPRIIYCGGSANTYINDCSLYRSVDGGKSFQVVTTNTTNSIVKNGVQSGFETVSIEVNPKTGELLFAGNCFGFSKLLAPYRIEDF
jgi:hypothetical protein